MSHTDFDEFMYEAIAKKNAKKELADRGKTLEGDLRKAFDARKSNVLAFDFERVPDARATQGRLRQPRTGDYILFCGTHVTIVEAKEIKHGFRLPVSSFDAAERGRLKRRALAGAKVYVVAMHLEEGTYRIAPIDWFDARTGGSFNMAELQPVTIEEIMNVLTAA